MPYNFDNGQYAYSGQPPDQYFDQNSQQQASDAYRGLPDYVLPQYQQPQQHVQFRHPQPQPQPTSQIQVIISSRQNQQAQGQQYSQHFPQEHPSYQAQYQQHSDHPQYLHYHPTHPPPQQRPPSQPAYQHNQQFVPLSQLQHQQPQLQYPTNGYPMMAASLPSPRPAARPPQMQQNGHLPTPPPTRSQALQQQAPTSPATEPDHCVLLLSLADEYFTAAYKLDGQPESYFKLIATGLGCLESVLTNFKLPELREAQISLRYAQVLYEETENYDDAERVLTKAIDICERQNFLDLKYTLQILSACVLYQSKPKAAIKDLQNMLEEIEAYNHTAWEYATWYQLTTFYLSANGVRDLHAAIQNLEKLSDAADSNGDKAVAAFANVVSAVLHLQTSSPDAVSSCQQALAKTRALSTDDEVSSIHQIILMMEYIDLCCSIRECNHTQGDEKRRRMQDTWTALVDKKGWIYDGDMLYIPIHETSLRGLQLQHGGLVRQRKDKYMLPFSWIGMNDAEAWGFLLCAISKAHKNNTDGGKAEAFIDHGLQRTRDANPFGDRTAGGVTSSQQKILECGFLVELAFLQCQKGQWNKANEAIKTIGERANEVGVGFPRSMTCIVEYLNGSIQQGLGNLDTALVSYQWEGFDMKQFMHTPEPKSFQHRSNDSEHATARDIAILAAMNRLLIISDSSHPQHNQCPPLIEQLNTLVKASQDKNIKASYTLIQSLVTNTGILRSKQALISALHAAKAISNAQITALVLITMQQKHFLGVTDEHAAKCVRATSMQMKNWGNPMWMHVAAGVEAEALEFQGKPVEARGKMQEARVRAEGLPEGIRGLLKM